MISPHQLREKARARRLIRTKPKALEEYQLDPIGFFCNELDIPEWSLRWSLNDGYKSHRWDGNVDPLIEAAEALANNEHVGIESGTGSGKSFLISMLKLWFTGSFEEARTFTFAPKEDQLRLYSWTETTKLWPRFQRRFPLAQLTDLRIRMIHRSDAWGAWGFPVQVKAGAQVASSAAGMHARHLLLIYEEMQGIEQQVVRAGRNTLTGEHNLMIGVGNPDHQQDTLHLHCKRKTVRHIRISSYDHPNVVAGQELIGGAVTQKSIDERAADDGIDSPIFQSRVRGISPAQASNAVIRLQWLEAAARAALVPHIREQLSVGELALGVDVANSEGGDEAAIARGVGACLLEVESFQCPDALKLGTDVALEMAASGIDERHVGVDGVGVGASTVNRLKSLRLYVQDLQGGPVSDHDEDWRELHGYSYRLSEKFRTLRAQMIWQLRIDLQHGRILLPEDEELFQELVSILWEPDKGYIKIEEKKELKKRLGRSPNRADAVIYWNWVRPRRKMDANQKAVSAWDPDVLAWEAQESRRVREAPPTRNRRIDPALTERVR